MFLCRLRDLDVQPCVLTTGKCKIVFYDVFFLNAKERYRYTEMNSLLIYRLTLYKMDASTYLLMTVRGVRLSQKSEAVIAAGVFSGNGGGGAGRVGMSRVVETLRRELTPEHS